MNPLSEATELLVQERTYHNIKEATCKTKENAL
jgi:hypothetical protein